MLSLDNKTLDHDYANITLKDSIEGKITEHTSMDFEQIKEELYHYLNKTGKKITREEYEDYIIHLQSKHSLSRNISRAKIIKNWAINNKVRRVVKNYNLAKRWGWT